tara:strand:- start:7749 stop:8519 length:771 start_codon:yes stop_codon:yes gene_type:complete
MNSYYFDDYKITELSYFEYKNLVKNLISAEDHRVVDIFEEIINNKVESKTELNIGNKIKILLLLRSITLGEEIELNLNNKLFKYDINKIVDSIKFKTEQFKYRSLIFNAPKKIHYKSKFECLIDNFYSFVIDGKIKIIEEYTYKQKEILLQNLIGFETKELTNEFNEYISNFCLKYIDDAEINLYDINLLKFIKSLFQIDLNEMYDIEYNIMNHLKFDPAVFNMYGLPELRIFLNKFIKEQEESKKQTSGNNGLTL